MSVRALHPRHRIDIEPDEIVRALAACARPPRGAGDALEAPVSDARAVIVTLSVRSAFDLLLSCLALDPGS